MNSKVICIVGPTASGKTGLSINLAKKINAEIISADSMQIYKGLDIATAKVTKKEADGIPHHMIDICDIGESFSVADFKNMCYDKISEIQSRGKNVIIVGGTGLYVSSIVDNMNFKDEEVDLEYRKKLEELADTNSKEYVHNILKEIDPVSAENIHPNNLKRVIRAIEIAKKTDTLKSVHMENENARKQNEKSKYEFLVFCLDIDRELLYERINKRVDLMVKNGALSEAKFLYEKKLPSNNTCMQAIGYKEFFPYFRGEKTLEECIEELKKETRKYSKRQMTWFRNKLSPIYLDGKKTREELTENIIEYL